MGVFETKEHLETWPHGLEIVKVKQLQKPVFFTHLTHFCVYYSEI